MDAQVQETIEASTEALIEAVKVAAAQEADIDTLTTQLQEAQAEITAYKQASANFFDTLQTSGLLGAEDITKMAAGKDDPAVAFAVAGQALELIADSQSSGFGVEKKASTTQEDDPWELVRREGA